MNFMNRKNKLMIESYLNQFQTTVTSWVVILTLELVQF